MGKKFECAVGAWSCAGGAASAVVADRRGPSRGAARRCRARRSDFTRPAPAASGEAMADAALSRHWRGVSRGGGVDARVRRACGIVVLAREPAARSAGVGGRPCARRWMPTHRRGEDAISSALAIVGGRAFRGGRGRRASSA